MTIKLIATDMDDTLLNSKVEVSPRNQAALKAAQEAGIIVLIATGRMFASAQIYAKELGLDVPLVTYNGGLVKGSISEKVYYEGRLQLPTALDVLAYCREKGFYVQVYQDNELFIDKPNEISRQYEKISKFKPQAIGAELYTPAQAPNKLLVVTSGDDFDKVWQEMAAKFAGRIDISSSKTNFLEIMEPNVNKWNSVKAVGEMYDIKPEEIMCIGDSNNDLPMVKNAGIGVAVANANEAVRKAAKIITADHDADGVALVIESVLTKQIEVPEI